MQYWLVKSEPDAFSWDQQVANGVEPWTGRAQPHGQAQSEGDEDGRSGVLLPFQRGQGDRRRGGGGARGLSGPHGREGRLGVRRHEGGGADAEAGDAGGDQGGSRSSPIWRWCGCRGCRWCRCRSRTGTGSAGWADGSDERRRKGPLPPTPSRRGRGRTSGTPPPLAGGGWGRGQRALCRIDEIPDGAAKGFPPAPGGFTGLFAVRQGERSTST